MKYDLPSERDIDFIVDTLHKREIAECLLIARKERDELRLRVLKLQDELDETKTKRT